MTHVQPGRGSIKRQNIVGCWLSESSKTTLYPQVEKRTNFKFYLSIHRMLLLIEWWWKYLHHTQDYAYAFYAWLIFIKLAYIARFVLTPIQPTSCRKKISHINVKIFKNLQSILDLGSEWQIHLSPNLMPIYIYIHTYAKTQMTKFTFRALSCD